METVYIWGVGFLLGLKHSLEPDHVMAVSAMVSRHGNPLRSALTGLFWGIGHTTTLLIAALVILAFGLSVPPSLERWFELFVGVALIWLGVAVVRRAVDTRLHIHRHKHEGRVHVHFHTHEQEETHELEHSHEHGRSVLIGMAHGFAGSAGLMLLMVSQVDTLLNGLVYVAVFGIGSIIGMMVFGGVVSLPLQASSRLPRVNTVIRFSVGMGSLGMGLFIIAANWP